MKTARDRSQAQEDRVADRFGGQRTPGSGNGWARKNDVRTPTTSFEMKVTDKRQFTVKEADLIQGERNALLDGRDFVFGIEMSTGRRWVVISEDDYHALLTEE